MDEENENPVVNGLAALVAVALVIGLLAAIIALVGTRVFGITGGGGGSTTGVAAGDTLYLPSPKPTELDSRLLVTLAPTPAAQAPRSSATKSTPKPSASTRTATPTPSPSSSAEPQILLSAGSSQVDEGESLMLSGTYREGEGSVLDIWYDVDGKGWEEFNLDVNVYGGVFQAFVSTYETGTITWRVQDKESGARSNEVAVHHGAE